MNEELNGKSADNNANLALNKKEAKFQVNKQRILQNKKNKK